MSAAVPATLMNESTDFLIRRPSYEEIITFKPSEMLNQRLLYLMERNSDGEITTDELSNSKVLCVSDIYWRYSNQKHG